MARFGSLLQNRALKAGAILLAAGLLAGPGWSAAATTVTGAGASFPAPIYSVWLQAYQKLPPDVQIAYQALGSGGGIRLIMEGTADFGGTDGPMNDKQLLGYKDAHGFSILHFPTVLGAAVPAYNIPGNP
jgi:phosphate transport system substrate-binding protein